MQYDHALKGTAESRITSTQRSAGVKDYIAQPIIEWILTRRKEVLKSVPPASKLLESELETILRTELKQHGRALHVNPLLEMPGMLPPLYLCSDIQAKTTHYLIGFNVHLDTPIEILHTVLLGSVKYYWRFTCKLLDDGGRADIFRMRFNSLSLSGLEMGTQCVPEYICKYRGGLTGKHFRFVVQLIVFACYDLIPREIFRIWVLLGRLTVLFWYTSIRHMDSYTVSLS